MKNAAIITFVAACAVLPSIAMAESTRPIVPESEPEMGAESGGEIGQGVDLLGRGTRLLLRGLLEEVEPTMREMGRALDELNWQGLGIDDLGEYHAPEVLPNGDIIMRRKLPLELPPPSPSEIDL